MLALTVVVSMGTAAVLSIVLMLAYVREESTTLPILGLIACVAAPAVVAKVTSPPDASGGTDAGTLAATMTVGVAGTTLLAAGSLLLIAVFAFGLVF